MKRRLLDALDLVLSLLLLLIILPLAGIAWLLNRPKEQQAKQAWEQQPTFRRSRDMRFRK